MTESLAKILITDGETRAALAATRALGRRGHAVMVTGRGEGNLAAASRYCSRSWSVGDPEATPGLFAEQIREIVCREKIDILLPMAEQTIRCLYAVPLSLPPTCRFAAAPRQAFETLSDKVNLARLAITHGIGLPQTLFVPDGSRIASAGIAPLTYPVVIKPMATRIVTATGMLHGRVLHADHEDRLMEIYRIPVFQHYPSIVQERICGSGTGLFTLFDRDRHLALFSHRRLREKPPSGGVSVVCESVPLDPEMVRDAQKLLTAVGWKGVAMVEFKRDDRDGKAKLIEVNGRFWGSLQLAVAAGIDFPGLLVDYLMGKAPDTVIDQYLIGYKLKWLPGLLDHLLIRIRRSRKDLHLPPDHESIWRALFDSLRILERNTSYDSLCRDDPKPFLREMKIYCRTALGKT
jgi:biotin carboxylase